MKREIDDFYKFVKRYTPSRVKKAMQNFYKTLYYREMLGAIKKETGTERIILVGTPEHGNLGDHAIAKAEILFLKNNFPLATIIEISGNCFRYHKNEMKKYICISDRLVITGGGFLGSLWLQEEELARDIIRLFPENKIVIFPQTVFFEKNSDGIKIYQESLEIFRRHKNLVVCTRDTESYELMTKAIFNGDSAKCLYIPDIATYLIDTGPVQTRNGILLCLRKDKERIISHEDAVLIEKYAFKYSDHVEFIDTVVSRNVAIDMREKELESKFREFRGAKLVITDRLHGMIFAAITGTPCIVLNNISGKVFGVYRWLTYLDYIQCVECVEDIPENIARLINMESCTYDNSCLSECYQKLARVL